LLGLFLFLGEEEGSVDQGSSKKEAMSGGSGSFLEIQPSELAFPCKSSQISPLDRVVWLMSGGCCDCLLLMDLGQSWDAGDGNEVHAASCMGF